MNILETTYLKDIYKNCQEVSLHGKWITLDDILPLLDSLKNEFKIEQIGSSEENRAIYSLKIGTGSKKILVWSQMHGNESTGTKALFDLFNCFKNDDNDAVFNKILEECTLLFIPMLNPDGALKYTRVNANRVDLNRDAVDRKAKESQLLRAVLEDFNPDFSFNLHDQRTIFGVEGTDKPATISFLAPSEEESRAITVGRKETMNVIIAMNRLLQNIIPNHVGRYTDEFYPTATGDNFQKIGYNTILIESGHFPNDYQREVSRKYTFFSILQGVFHIANTSDFSDFEAYFNIPNNVESFYDVIHRYPHQKDVAYQYEDSIKNKTFVSTLKKVPEDDLTSRHAHHEIDFEN